MIWRLVVVFQGASNYCPHRAPTSKCGSVYLAQKLQLQVDLGETSTSTQVDVRGLTIEIRKRFSNHLFLCCFFICLFVSSRSRSRSVVIKDVSASLFLKAAITGFYFNRLHFCGSAHAVWKQTHLNTEAIKTTRGRVALKGQFQFFLLQFVERQSTGVANKYY